MLLPCYYKLKKTSNTDLKVAVDGTHGNIKLLVDTGCVMNQRLGYSRVKLILTIVKINTEVFSKEIEKGERKNY